MGLRIRSNIDSLIATRSAEFISRLLTASTERLSTSKRINRAADDPAGAFQVSLFKAQLASLSQAKTSTQLGINELSTLDSALGSISAQIDNIITAIGAADQDALDTALDAINTVSSTTRFGNKRLLSGERALRPTSLDGRLQTFALSRLDFNGLSSGTLSVDLVTTANRAGATFANATGGAAGLTVEVAGPFGTTSVSIGPGAGQAAALTTAIGAAGATTGVVRTAATQIQSVTRGSDVAITLTPTAGDGSFTIGATTYGVGSSYATSGADAVARVNNAPTRTYGMQMTAGGPHRRLFLEFRDDVASGSSFTLTIPRGGESFLLSQGGTGNDTLTLGFPAITTATLGRATVTNGGLTAYGFLESLRTGRENSIASNDDNALRIANAAKTQLDSLRSYYGAVSSKILSSQVSLLTNQLTQVDDARSRIEDVDMAEEAAVNTRLQVMLQVALATSAQANLIPSTVAKLMRFPS